METIDEAALTDVPQLAELLELLFSQEADFQPDRAKQERGLNLIIEAPWVGRVFAARDGDQLVGMVLLVFTVSTAEGGPVCLLEDLVVRADHRGNGLGTRLLLHALAYADTHGYSRVTLLTDRVNEGALRLYRRHGFVASGMQVLRRSVRPGDPSY